MIPDWVLMDVESIARYMEDANAHAIAVVDDRDDLWLVFTDAETDELVAQGIPQDGDSIDANVWDVSRFEAQQWPLVVLQRPGVES